MRKLVQSTVNVKNKEIVKIQEELSNLGSLPLEKKPRSNALTKDIIEVLKNHKLIDIEDDIVELLITVRS